MNKDLVKGGTKFLNKYDNSPFILFQNVYPEYEWLPWRFSDMPKQYWSDSNTVRNYLIWVGKQLGIKEFQEWESVLHAVYSVLVTIVTYIKDFVRVGGPLVIKHKLRLAVLLPIAFPEHSFNFENKSVHFKKSQFLLKACLFKMFPQKGKKSIKIYEQ